MLKLDVGTRLSREYNGKKVTVVQRKDGVEYKDKIYKSLSAAVLAITKGKKYPATVFFKDALVAKGVKSSPRAAKGSKRKNAVHAPETPAIDIRGMIREVVNETIHDIVATEVGAALQSAFRGTIEQ